MAKRKGKRSYIKKRKEIRKGLLGKERRDEPYRDVVENITRWKE